VQIDTRKNTPTILTDEEADWKPEFYPTDENGKPGKPLTYGHGTCVSIVMEASYVRGKLSVDEYLTQCAVVNPHLQLHYRITALKKEEAAQKTEDRGQTTDDGGKKAEVKGAKAAKADKASDLKKDGKQPATGNGQLATDNGGWITFFRANKSLPPPPREIKPHPHGVELGLLMQMLKNTPARTLRSALSQDFSRVSTGVARQICEKAGLNPKANPTRIAHQESEALYKAINETKLMRPPTDCLSPIGEEHIIAGLKKEIQGDFFTAVTRAPTVYRGNPFQIEVGVAYVKPGENVEIKQDDPVRVMRFANRVPLLHMAGGCAITRAITNVDWRNYGLSQPRDAVPVGPMVVMVHMASVWVPFTSESKEAIAHYPEIVKEMVLALQECGRQLSVYLSKRRRLAEMERKRNYITLYIPHLALGLKDILDLNDKQEHTIVRNLNKMLEKTHLEVEAAK
jgi:DNA topoisomerase VI subunit B